MKLEEKKEVGEGRGGRGQGKRGRREEGEEEGKVARRGELELTARRCARGEGGCGWGFIHWQGRNKCVVMEGDDEREMSLRQSFPARTN